MSVRESAIAMLSDWRAPSPPQDALREAMLGFALARPDGCRRDCVPGHITASVIVVDETRSRVLLTLHPRLHRWVQLGGHCEDDDADIVAAARREGVEESGIADLTVDPQLVSVHVHPITCSLQIPTRHLDMQFLAYAPAEALIVRSDESIDLQWWPTDALPENSDYALAQLVSLACDRIAAQTSVE
jgi:8-oxo-dGTP pyrophosphatase MutT (NUDIX family)